MGHIFCESPGNTALPAPVDFQPSAYLSILGCLSSLTVLRPWARSQHGLGRLGIRILEATWIRHQK
eukprot:1153766-Pelagomonas_calceolata.AAC.4